MEVARRPTKLLVIAIVVLDLSKDKLASFVLALVSSAIVRPAELLIFQYVAGRVVFVAVCMHIQL